jgi:hypothetical protein
VISGTSGSGDDRLSGYATIDIRDADLTGLSLVLSKGMTIAGRVIVEGRNAGAASPELASLRVSLRMNPMVAGLADTSSATPRDDGQLSLPGIIPGDYIVNVAPLMNLPPATRPSPPPAVPQPLSPALAAGAAPIPASLQNAYVKSVRFGDSDVLNAGIRIGKDTAGILEIVIGTNPGQISGIALNEAGKPAAYSVVVLVPEAVRRNRLDLYRSAVTDSAGRFNVAAIPPGDYKVFGWDEVETGLWQEPEFIRSYEERGKPVRVGEGSRQQIELTVISAH